MTDCHIFANFFEQRWKSGNFMLKELNVRKTNLISKLSAKSVLISARTYYKQIIASYINRLARVIRPFESKWFVHRYYSFADKKDTVLANIQSHAALIILCNALFVCPSISTLTSSTFYFSPNRSCSLNSYACMFVVVSAFFSIPSFLWMLSRIVLHTFSTPLDRCL